MHHTPSFYFSYLMLIFFVKLLFFLSILYVIYSKLYDKQRIDQAKKWKRIFEYTFMILMSFLIFYLFQKNTIRIGPEENLLFIMFASVILMNSIQEIAL